MNLAMDLPISDYRILMSTEARSQMSTIMPQSSSTGQSVTMIVVRTVHGDSISVRMDLLGRSDSAHLSGDLPKSESSKTMHSVREAA